MHPERSVGKAVVGRILSLLNNEDRRRMMDDRFAINPGFSYSPHKKKRRDCIMWSIGDGCRLRFQG